MKGFTGPKCENHFCNYKNATKNEKIYLALATKNVCGTNKCKLNKNQEFECECPWRMEKTGNGFCKVNN